MKIIVNGQEHELDDGKDRIAYSVLCQMAGKDPQTKPIVMVKNKYEIKDNDQVFCTDGMIVNVVNTDT